jgi:hypothetical protein
VATFRNTPVKNLDTSAVTYLSSTIDSTIVLSILVCNTDGTSDSDVTVNMLDNSSVLLAKLANTITVPADSSVELLSNKLILTSGRKLSMLASSSGKLDVSISFVEV